MVKRIGLFFVTFVLIFSVSPLSCGTDVEGVLALIEFKSMKMEPLERLPVDMNRSNSIQFEGLLPLVELCSLSVPSQSDSSQESSSSSSQSISPSVSPLLKKEHLKSVLHRAPRKERPANPKKVQWFPTVEQMLFESELEIIEWSGCENKEAEYGVSENLSAGEEHQEFCFRKQNSSYKEYVDGVIMFAIEEAIEQKSEKPLVDLARRFAATLCASDTDESEQMVLHDALARLSKSSQDSCCDDLTSSDRQIPVCCVARNFYGESSHSVSPTLVEPLYRTVPLQEPQEGCKIDGDTEPVVCYTRCDDLFQMGLIENGTKMFAAIEERSEPSIADDDFEKALTQVIDSRNKDLLEGLLTSVFDSDSSQYERIKAALRHL